MSHNTATIHAGPSKELWDEVLTRSGIDPAGITEYNSHSRELAEEAESLSAELDAGPFRTNEVITRAVSLIRSLASQLAGTQALAEHYRKEAVAINARLDVAVSDMKKHPSLLKDRNDKKDRQYILLDEAVRLANEAKSRDNAIPLNGKSPVVNEAGKEEIRKFLALNGRGLSTEITDEMLYAMAAEAEEKMAQGHPPTVTLKAANCVRNKDMDITISEAGIDR